MNLTIIGGGNIAHAVAAATSLYFNKVSVLTTVPEKWKEKITVILPDETKFLSSRIYTSKNPEKVLYDSDVLLFTVPAHIIPYKLKEIKKYLPKDIIVGSVVASGGFFWIARNILGDMSNLFAFQRVPFICRIIDKGESVHITGYKDKLYMAGSFNSISFDKYEIFKQLFEKSFNTEISKLRSYLEVTISNSNPILHTSRLVNLIKNNNLKDPLFFYRTWDLESSENLLICDKEIMQIIDKLNIPFPLYKTLKEHYEITDAVTLTQKLSSIKAFENITFPVIKNEDGRFLPDPESRYFQEDLAFGLVVIKALAEIVKVPTPYIDSTIFNLQEYIKKEYISQDGKLNGKDIASSGIPQNYGFNTVDKIIQLKK